MVAALEDEAVIGEDAVRRELWISFGSLVRSYVAAAQMGMEVAQVLVLQEEPDELELVSESRTIRIVLDAGQSAGYWVLHQGPALSPDTLLAEGAFRMGMDSLVEWTGLPGRQEMDAVAEALATLVLE